MAILAAGVMIAPRGLRAQEAATTPAAGTAAQAPNLNQPGVAKSEQEDNNIYRHTKTVEAVAKALNLSTETTARGFEYINFAIIFFAIVIPLGRILPKALRRRSEQLGKDIAAARKVSDEAKERMSAVEAKLAGLGEEMNKFRAEVESELVEDEKRIKTSLEEERERIVTSAEQEISAAAAHAQRTLRHFAADLAIEQAAKQLVLTPETDRALIAEFVRSANGDKGGQN